MSWMVRRLAEYKQQSGEAIDRWLAPILAPGERVTAVGDGLIGPKPVWIYVGLSPLSLLELVDGWWLLIVALTEAVLIVVGTRLWKRTFIGVTDRRLLLASHSRRKSLRPVGRTTSYSIRSVSLTGFKRGRSLWYSTIRLRIEEPAGPRMVTLSVAKNVWWSETEDLHRALESRGHAGRTPGSDST